VSRPEDAFRDPDAGRNLPRFQQVQLDFAAYIRHPQRHPAPEGIEPRRLAIYAELFFDNVEGFLAGTFPVTKSIVLARQGEDAWRALARDFLHRHRCTSPLFLEIPEEFLAYLRDERGAAAAEAGIEDPPWLHELCHYEWVELALDVADVELPEAGPDADPLDGRPRVSPLVEALGYRWPVHELGPDHVPEAPPEQPTWLLVHRDRGERVRFTTTNAVTVRLLELLRSDADLCGREALRTLAGELGHADPDALEDAGRTLLEDLLARDVLLGVDP
jgi:hypothetical protein